MSIKKAKGEKGWQQLQLNVIEGSSVLLSGQIGLQFKPRNTGPSGGQEPRLNKAFGTLSPPETN